MKTLFIFMLAMSFSVFAISAESVTYKISPTDASVNPGRVVNIHQFKKSDNNAGFNAVEIGLGMSTDVSPQIALFLGYNRNQEMTNTWATYKLGEFLSVSKYERLSAGIYVVEGMMFTGNLFDDIYISQVRIKIDTTAVWIENEKMLEVADYDFVDGPVNADISVTVSIIGYPG